MIGPGLHPVPEGHLAMVVTYLEMTAPPGDFRDAPAPEGSEIVAWPAPDLSEYRALMRRIGKDWLWTARLRLDDAALATKIRDPGVEVWRLVRGAEVLGLAELDFAVPGACAVAYFGVVPEAIGTTAARHLMAFATRRAWARPISRFWLHTCTLDSPKALDFYRRSGFRDYARAVEIMPDPRLDGTLPRDAAPQVAIL